jgi:2-hydroxychromene-2-carboxylate isomerase
LEDVPMMPKVQFLFDVGSPNAYLVHKVIPSVEHRTGVEFEYVPVLLGGIFKLTSNRSPAEAFSGVRNKREFMALETRRFIAKHKLNAFQPNPHFPVITLALMRGCVAAQLDGSLDRYVEAAFHHMWEAPKKLDDPVIIRTALAESGLDAEHLMARAQEDDVKSGLIANTQSAVERGAFGSPTFFVEDEMYFGKDQLRDVEEAIQAGLARS